MVSIIKILLFIWPFVKEMVLGDKSLRQAMKDNKRKVAIAFFIIASLALNMVTLTRLWTLSAQYLELEKRQSVSVKKKPNVPTPVSRTHDTQGRPPKQQDLVELKEPNRPVIVPDPVPPKKPRLVKSSKSRQQAALRAKKLKESFDKIKKREETNGSV